MAKAPIFQMGKVRPTERGWLGQGRQPVKQAAGTPYPWSARLSTASGGVEGTPNLSRPLAPAATDPARPPHPAVSCSPLRRGEGKGQPGEPLGPGPCGPRARLRWGGGASSFPGRCNPEGSRDGGEVTGRGARRPELTGPPQRRRGGRDGARGRAADGPGGRRVPRAPRPPPPPAPPSSGPAALPDGPDRASRPARPSCARPPAPGRPEPPHLGAPRPRTLGSRRAEPALRPARRRGHFLVGGGRGLAGRAPGPGAGTGGGGRPSPGPPSRPPWRGLRRAPRRRPARPPGRARRGGDGRPRPGQRRTPAACVPAPPLPRGFQRRV